MTRRANRLLWILFIFGVLMIATGLTLFALRETVAFAVSPAEMRTLTFAEGQQFRLFGLVEPGSIRRGDNLTVRFDIALEGARVTIQYDDLLPDTFREGQGVIAEGSLQSEDLFVADRVLARHDENYIPREFADKLKDEGVWRGNEYNQ